MTRWFRPSKAIGGAALVLIFYFIGGLDAITAAILVSYGYGFTEVDQLSNQIVKSRPLNFTSHARDAASAWVAAFATAYVLLIW